MTKCKTSNVENCKIPIAIDACKECYSSYYLLDKGKICHKKCYLNIDCSTSEFCDDDSRKMWKM